MNGLYRMRQCVREQRITVVGEIRGGSDLIAVDRNIERLFDHSGGRLHVDQQSVGIALVDGEARARGPINHRLLVLRRRREARIPFFRGEKFVELGGLLVLQILEKTPLEIRVRQRQRNRQAQHLG